jgi:hypothetical protein
MDWKQKNVVRNGVAILQRNLHRDMQQVALQACYEEFFSQTVLYLKQTNTYCHFQHLPRALLNEDKII